MSGTIYVLTDGDYSDYHIEAVFTNKEKAEKIAEEYGFDMEEYINGKIDYDGHYYSVELNQLGEVISTYSYPSNSKNFEHHITLRRYDKGFGEKVYNITFPIFLKKKNENKAIKIVSEYFTILKANNILTGEDVNVMEKNANAILFGDE